MARRRRGASSEERSSDVPFIADWRGTGDFNDLDHVEKVDDLSRMLDGWRLEPIAPGEGGVEAAVGRVETADAAVLSVLARHARAVCRISVPPGPYYDYENVPADGGWTGTGFLVGQNLLLTNHHVLNSLAVAEAATAEFDYQVSERDLLDGPPDDTPSAKVFRLNPRRLFVTSGMRDLDYSFVWIETAAAEDFGSIRMTRGSFVVRQTEPVYIVHHPNGDPKQVSLDDTEVLSMNSAALLYAADTEGGSSGAPVFCRRGRLVGLHHAWHSTQAAKARFPMLTGRLNDGTFTDVVNEGIKLSAMAIDLERRIAAGGKDATAAATVLTAFAGSDTLTGLFGSLGRHAKGEVAEGAVRSAYEQVVQVYAAREMDIDVGAWNVAWFNRDHDKAAKRDLVAKIVTDLNLDIWVLVDVSPEAVAALVDTLQAQYHQEYRFSVFEPDEAGERPCTAVLWRPNVVEGASVDWPEDIDRLLRESSREATGPEAVQGPIFNRYPGLFRFRLRSETKDFDFFLVPLHLRSEGEGSLRRRLASKVLSFAVQRMIERQGADRDWLLLGDVTATLASESVAPLVARGFTPLSAADQESGAFTYLKSPQRSLIDNIFVSENLSGDIAQEQFFIVPTDRSVGRFLSDVAEHRPIALRLALADLPAAAPGEPTPRAAPADENAAFTALLATAGLAAAPAPVRAPAGDWVTAGLTKVEFLKANGSKLAREIARVNAASGTAETALHLTAEDVAAVFMAEAGIGASGRLDPGFVHSNGEHGLLPLPDNIAFWIGPGAPAHDAPMPVEANIRAYLAYLSALKTKPVKRDGERTLYPDLFREPGIAGQPDRGAKLLAGVVHGYFWGGNYADGAVPLEHLIEGFRTDVALGPLLARTGYVHAGKPLLDGRQRNLETGLAFASALA